MALLVFPIAPWCAADEDSVAKEKKEEKKPVLTVKRIEVLVGSEGSRFTENVYIAYKEKSKDAILVDPGAQDGRIEDFVKKNRLKVRMILNTHGHHDHIGANTHYGKRYKVSVYAHGADEPYYGPKGSKNRPDTFLDKEGDLKNKHFDVKVIHTPGHSPGSVCYLIEGVLFSGDTLFKSSVGRTWGDTPDEEKAKLKEEVSHIKKKLLVLPEETLVYPGHGGSSTIGDEKKNNPFLK
jgi:glyoxylase-like metal-dependent hydrolase (beta-lactamase superfamily II)